MAGGPSRALSHWLVSVQSQWIVGVVRSGFRLLWKDGKAPLVRRPPAFRPPSSQEAISVLRSEIDSLVQKGAVEKVLDHSSPGFYGRLFAVPKASGAWRPVLDLSFLNTFLREIRFKMETPASVRDSLRPGDWATSIDLTDAYFHILMHPADRKWLRFRWASQVYQFRALPFGLSLAPWVFTMVVRQVCALVRSRGVRLRAYLDDWLILSQSQAGCEQDTQSVLREANLFGFSINRSKSELTPCQTFTYLGMSFDTVAWTVQPSQKRVDKLQACIRSTLPLPRASLRTLASILGQMESMSLLVPLGRVHKRPFQLALKPFVDSPTVDWNALIPLQGWFQSATLPWLDTEWVCRGVPIALPAPDLDLFTDASLMGWGAHTDQLTASETSGGPFCHQVLEETTSVRLTIPGSRGVGDERDGHFLVRPGGLRVPAIPVTHTSSQEGGAGGPVPPADRSSLAVSAVVPGPAETRPGPSHSSRSHARRTGTASHRQPPRRASDAESSRVEVVRSSLRRKGASDLTMDLVGRSHRASTSSVYESHWRAWVTWCHEHRLDATAPRTMHVANHLAFMSSQGASAASLKVRRSAISATLRQIGRSIDVSGVIAGVIKGASLADVKSRTPVPKWDLLLVMEFLRSADFEPLRDASFANLTRKSLFLLLLASARRGSEIHALSGNSDDISFESDGSVTLRFRPEFLAKNQAPERASPLVHVRPLSTILAPNDPDLVNCPVRALRIYLARAQSLRSAAQKLLFISLNTERHKDITKTTLARWVSALIKHAYEWSRRNEGGTQPVLPLESARAHETRAWASSLAVLRSRRLEEVLHTAYWRSEDVFMNFYLRDISALRQDGSRALPAMVAGGQLLTRI
ncbi:uncharacterized protein [Littorina saxatilis]|uniref:uncharacterized protein n=1 Tax=Littorina saxatilis TaxID=31220 RepID=UPI0038B6A81E